MMENAAGLIGGIRLIMRSFARESTSPLLRKGKGESLMCIYVYIPRTQILSQPVTFPLFFLLQIHTYHRSTFCLGGIMLPRRTRQEQEQQQQQQQQAEKEELDCPTKHQQQQHQHQLQQQARGGSRSNGGREARLG